QPEALRVPLQPLEIVQQAPAIVRFDRVAVADRLRDHTDVRPQELYFLRVTNPAVRIRRAVVGRSIFGHVQYAVAAGFPGHRRDDFVQALRIDLPPEVGTVFSIGRAPDRTDVETGHAVGQWRVLDEKA